MEFSWGLVTGPLKFIINKIMKSYDLSVSFETKTKFLITFFEENVPVETYTEYYLHIENVGGKPFSIHHVEIIEKSSHQKVQIREIKNYNLPYFLEVGKILKMECSKDININGDVNECHITHAHSKKPMVRKIKKYY